jgi:hypothetical protein
MDLFVQHFLFTLQSLTMCGPIETVFEITKSEWLSILNIYIYYNNLLHGIPLRYRV